MVETVYFLIKPIKMKYNIFQVDAFTTNLFSGNPACVVPLKKWLADDLLLKIAKENAVAETAFFIDNGKEIQLRWFTPDLEIDLCGHATLAAAHVLKIELKNPANPLLFNTKSGKLEVLFKNNYYHLNFPSRKPTPTDLPRAIKSALNIQPKEIYKARDYLLVYENQQEIENIKIDRQIFDTINLGVGGVIVTAKGDSSDFVSRFFTPQATLLEDPVTGSAHCTLIPYWAKKLAKNQLNALQLSLRGGELYCENIGERVIIAGKAKLYLKGSFSI